MFYKGNKSKAICSKCEKIVETTFKHRLMTINKSKKKRLVSVCNECNEIVGIPQQSFLKGSK